MSEGFEKLIDSVQQLTHVIAGSLGVQLEKTKDRVNAIPNKINIKVNYDEGDRPKALKSGTVSVKGYQGGTKGFEDFGAGTLVMLHGREAVVPRARRASAGSRRAAGRRECGRHHRHQRAGQLLRYAGRPAAARRQGQRRAHREARPHEPTASGLDGPHRQPEGVPLCAVRHRAQRARRARTTSSRGRPSTGFAATARANIIATADLTDVILVGSLHVTQALNDEPDTCSLRAAAAGAAGHDARVSATRSASVGRRAARDALPRLHRRRRSRTGGSGICSRRGSRCSVRTRCGGSMPGSSRTASRPSR